jgi:hypothetical protein
MTVHLATEVIARLQIRWLRDEAQWSFTRLPLRNSPHDVSGFTILATRHLFRTTGNAITSCARRPHPWGGTGCRGTGPNTYAHSLAVRQCSRIPSVPPHLPAVGPSGQNRLTSSSAAPFFPTTKVFLMLRAVCRLPPARSSSARAPPPRSPANHRATASTGKLVGATEIADTQGHAWPCRPPIGATKWPVRAGMFTSAIARATPRRRTHQLPRLAYRAFSRSEPPIRCPNPPLAQMGLIWDGVLTCLPRGKLGEGWRVSS